MGNKYLLPKSDGVRDMMELLLGTDIGVADGEPLSLDEEPLIAVYVNDDGEVACVCLCDMHFAAFAGSALSMIPAGTAKEAADEGDPSDTMLENLHEVLNVLARQFVTKDGPHAKLETLYLDAEDLPLEAADMIESPPAVVAYQVTVKGYGDGRLAFHIT